MKKILAFLMVMLVAMPSLGIAYAEERLETDSRYKSAYSFITSLGIVDGTRDAAEVVTRAEFADMVVRALVLPEGEWKTSFSDVEKSTPMRSLFQQQLRWVLFRVRGILCFVPTIQ